jgi:hypothetical protein
VCRTPLPVSSTVLFWQLEGGTSSLLIPANTKKQISNAINEDFVVHISRFQNILYDEHYWNEEISRSIFHLIQRLTSSLDLVIVKSSSAQTNALSDTASPLRTSKAFFDEAAMEFAKGTSDFPP